MITDIFQYDSIKDSKAIRNLILSFDKDFKSKYLSQYPNDINIGMKEDTFCVVDPSLMREYFQFFLKVLPEMNYVVIDCNYYSLGYMFIQSAALDIPNVREIKLYADNSDDQMDFRILKDSGDREKTYSRRQFLTS